MAKKLSKPILIDHFHGIPVYLTYKTVKRINFIFRDDKIMVSTSPNVSTLQIKKLFEENEQRFLEKLNNYKKKKVITQLPTFDNVKEIHSILIFGRKREIVYQLDDSEIQMTKNKIFIPNFYQFLSFNTWIKIVDRFIKETLSKYIQERLNYWEEKTGIHWNQFTIRKMKTLWGSCTYQKKTMRFNFYLAMLPKPAIDSVIIHELVHLLEPNHQKNYYRLLLSFDPNYNNKSKEIKNTYLPIPYLF